MGIFEMAKGAVQKLYDMKCDVYEFVPVRDEKRGADGVAEELKYKDVPCRISYKSVPSVQQTDTGAALKQAIKLFYPPEIEILPGSRIICGGEVYNAAGKAALYESHNETELTLKREWA